MRGCFTFPVAQHDPERPGDQPGDYTDPGNVVLESVPLGTQHVHPWSNKTLGADSMPARCWFTVVDDKPTSGHNSIIVPLFFGINGRAHGICRNVEPTFFNLINTGELPAFAGTTDYDYDRQ